MIQILNLNKVNYHQSNEIQLKKNNFLWLLILGIHKMLFMLLKLFNWIKMDAKKLLALLKLPSIKTILVRSLNIKSLANLQLLYNWVKSKKRSKIYKLFQFYKY